MIRNFRHKGLEAFFRTGSKQGVRPEHAKRLRSLLARLNTVQTPGDMNLPGLKLHSLHGDLKDHYAVSVSGNWRVIFRFESKDAVDVDYCDYH